MLLRNPSFTEFVSNWRLSTEPNSLMARVLKDK
jgi:hypothetical protein